MCAMAGSSRTSSYHTNQKQEEERMMGLMQKLWNDESGQGLAEYALLLGLIVIGVVLLIQGMGVSIQKIFTKANSDLGTAAAKAS
jgi:pilus assembly protein Flp/PilA